MESYYPCTWLSFVNQKNKKIMKWKLVNENHIYCSEGIIFRNNWSVYCIPILWICSQLNYYQLRIRSEILILNAFNVWQDHFRLKSPYFGCSFTFIYFSLHPLWICYAARCVHFTVPSERRGALFFLWEHMYTSGSTFIKKIKPVVCHYTSIPR